jgi:hypothetical protein
MFYPTNQKSSVAIFIGKPIPRPDRFLSRDTFTWTAKAKPILASHRPAQKALAVVKAGCK